jgi:hypothetical protein
MAKGTRTSKPVKNTDFSVVFFINTAREPLGN